MGAGTVPTDEAAWSRHGVAAEPDLVAERSLPRAWAARWAAAPAATALVDAAGTTTSGAQLEARSAAVAGRLAAAGLRPGDRVLMSCAPSVDLVVAHVAALRMGLVVVPVNTAFGRDELRSVLVASGAALAVVDEPARVAAVGTTCRAVTAAVELGDGPPPPLDLVDVDDPALLVFTSGTTGVPKGVPLTHGNVLASSESVRLAWRWTADDRLLLCLPLFHVHGLGVGVHGALLAGASAVVLPGFDVGGVLGAAAATGATQLFGVPTMWVRLVASGRVGELAGLRLAVSGSAPLAPEVFDGLAAAGVPVLERYGMTETGMLVSNPLHGERRAGSVGFALPGVRVRLDEAAPGGGDDVGEVLVAGPNVFAGYLDRPDANAASFQDGFFRTGDLGHVGGDGHLRLVGRSKELIITGGFNVYPGDVEGVLRRHPAVADVAVVGVPDAQWGERVVACVVAAEPVPADELLAFAAASLAPYRRPREVRFLDALPRNAMGKVVKAELR